VQYFRVPVEAAVELHIILSEDRDSTLPVLAARADQLWAHIANPPHDAAINAIAEESGQDDPTVAAVFGFQFERGSGSHGKPQGGRGGPRQGGNAAAGAAAGADKS
jgi:hypothetical protein